MAQVRAQEMILKTASPVTMTASVGTVATSGIAGISRVDSQTYSRPGYNPVYATWEVTAASDAATVNWSSSGGDALKNPVLRVRGYSSATPPTSVTFNGATLVAGTDVLMSVDTANSVLWLTLLRTASGASNTLAIGAVAAPPPCRMDIDGDGHVYPTTDGLILVRVMLGLTGTAVSNAAVVGSPRSTWADIRTYLNDSCAMGLP